MADADTLTLTLSSGGDVVIKLRPDLAPGHVERITTLARDGFYDGVTFHRVIPGFMAQGGDPKGTGMGGSDLPDLKAEFNAEPHVRGACSMARSQNPNSANSQFFICFDDARFLDGQYTVWGEVTEGMEHVDALPKGEPPAQPGRIVGLVGDPGLEQVLMAAPGGQRLGPRGGRHDVVGQAVGCHEHLELRRHGLKTTAAAKRCVGAPQASAATFIETILPGLRGGSPLGRASTLSIPSVTSPQTVYWPSRKRASSKQMKNWLLAELGSLVRAIEQAPRTCGSRLNSAFRSGFDEPPMPRPVGSPPWAMKPAITRWKTTPS